MGSVLPLQIPSDISGEKTLTLLISRDHLQLNTDYRVLISELDTSYEPLCSNVWRKVTGSSSKETIDLLRNWLEVSQSQVPTVPASLDRDIWLRIPLKKLDFTGKSRKPGLKRESCL
jgi:hypothetical protein